MSKKKKPREGYSFSRGQKVELVVPDFSISILNEKAGLVVLEPLTLSKEAIEKGIKINSKLRMPFYYISLLGIKDRWDTVLLKGKEYIVEYVVDETEVLLCDTQHDVFLKVPTMYLYKL